ESPLLSTYGAPTNGREAGFKFVMPFPLPMRFPAVMVPVVMMFCAPMFVGKMLSREPHSAPPTPLAMRMKLSDAGLLLILAAVTLKSPSLGVVTARSASLGVVTEPSMKLGVLTVPLTVVVPMKFPLSMVNALETTERMPSLVVADARTTALVVVGPTILNEKRLFVFVATVIVPSDS